MNEEFLQLRRKVSFTALTLLREQLDMALEEDYNEAETCSGSFSLRFGLPCKHFLHDKIKLLRRFDPGATYYVLPKQIHQHWLLKPPRATGGVVDEDDEVPLPLNPIKIKAKGRPRGATTKTLSRALTVAKSIAQGVTRGKYKKRERKKPSVTEPRDLTASEHTQASQQRSKLTSKPPLKRTQTKPGRRVTKKTKRTVIEEVEEVEEPVKAPDEVIYVSSSAYSSDDASPHPEEPLEDVLSPIGRRTRGAHGIQKPKRRFDDSDS
jgi:hypothetical protein